MPFRLGKYEIVTQIGAGGMATVYRARLHAHLHGSGLAVKDVAVKVIHPTLCEDHEFSLMFVDEVRLAMAMGHRNIVETFDAGNEDGQQFMVMELIEGCSLRELLAALPSGEMLPIELALFICAEVCAALEYAHAFRRAGSDQGIIHRDVSPSNILLSTLGEVRLADFGIAKAAGRLVISSVNLLKGKLCYMAPEQARGDVEPRSDLFALGAVLYELCCGRPLRRDISLHSVLAAPQIDPPTRYRSDLPPSLEALILRCLGENPADRPKDAAELRRLLGQEAFALQVRRGMSSDMHAELRAFLAAHLRGEGESPPPPTSRKRDERIVEAMMKEALAVPTDHGELTRPDGSEGDHELTSRPEQPSVEATAATLVATPAEAFSDTFASLMAKRADGGRPSWRLLVPAALLLAVSGILLALLLRDSPRKLAPAAALPATEDGQIAPAMGHDLQAGEPSQRKDAGLDIPPAREATPRQKRQGRRRNRGALTRRNIKRPIRRHGTLDINATPWAQVYLGGRLLGTTPLQKVSLPAGRHRLRLVNRQWKVSRSLDVVITPGKNTRKVVDLQR